ncbi:MAG: hypothetical protein MZV65_46495 [Chromatiales bacterium]|nr:hypothetical protein [Chromatiales bacterium]
MSIFVQTVDNYITAAMKLLQNAAPGYTYLNQFREFVDQNGGGVAGLQAYGSALANYTDPNADNAALAAQVVASLGITDAELAATATANIQALLESAGANRGVAIMQLVDIMVALQNDPTWGTYATGFVDTVNAAYVYSVNPANNSTELPILQAAISPEASPSTFALTAGQDSLVGTAAADTFKANVVQNALGAQVNSLGSGDSIDGGAGIDTLNAKITSGVFAGGSWSMPIQPETKSVEIIKLEAVIADVAFGYDQRNLDQVYVNARDMEDVLQLWSNRSDADLTIMNLTTKGLDQLSDMTIGMAYTGNADTRWGASDFHVYFDQDYLTPEATRTNPSVDFLAMNEDGYDASNGLLPLAGVFFRELQFTLNGETFDLTEYLNEDPAGAGDEITTYDEFLAAVQAALVELKADNPDNAALQTVTASFGQQFKTDVDPVTLVQREGVAVRLTVDGLTNGEANTLTVVSTDLEVARAAAATVPNNNRYEIAEPTPPVEGAKIGINVALGEGRSGR